MSHPHLVATRPYRFVADNAHPRASADIIRNRAVESDDRWPKLAAALAHLRLAKRRSVRIVDADCGAGALLIHAAHYARGLGFTAIEGRGIDGVPSLVARARGRAAMLADPAIGLSFEVADVCAALTDEAEFPADIVLWHRRPGPDMAVATAVAGAARLVISDAREVGNDRA